MNRAQRWSLILGLGLTVAGNSAAAKARESASPDPSLTITIHVYNYAEVDQKTLAEAENATAGIFREAGVRVLWIDAAPLSGKRQQVSMDQTSLDLTHITLNILPDAMANRLGSSNEVMGSAPGGGRDRRVAYVFYDRIDRVNRLQAQVSSYRVYVRTSEILGNAMAHELGHLLLNMQGHLRVGIMRGAWELEDLQAIASGRLAFTPQQAKVLRTEVIRRIGQHEPTEATGLQSLTLAH